MLFLGCVACNNMSLIIIELYKSYQEYSLLARHILVTCS